MLNKVGKKTRQWVSDKRKLVAALKNDTRYTVVGQNVYGVCPDCYHWHKLTPDHVIKRSLGGGNGADNIAWVCNTPGCYCHSKRDNVGTTTKKKKKPNWQTDHKCKECKELVPGMLLCPHCGKISV